jgi:peptide deformylase
MSLRTILIHPDARLRKKCELVKNFDSKLENLTQDMLETMYEAPGIGLAAPQIGVMLQVFVMDCALKDEKPNPLILINPSILWHSEETSVHSEGCLSIPEQYEEVTRPKSVKVSFHNVKGVVSEISFEGIEATCSQHEIDHLNGKLFIDYLSNLKKKMITDKMKKLKRELARK